MAIAGWLNENGIYAIVESVGRASWVNLSYKKDQGFLSANLVITEEGAMRLGGCGNFSDIPLALPDSLDRLIVLIKSSTPGEPCR